MLKEVQPSLIQVKLEKYFEQKWFPQLWAELIMYIPTLRPITSGDSYTLQATFAELTISVMDH